MKTATNKVPEEEEYDDRFRLRHCMAPLPRMNSFNYLCRSGSRESSLRKKNEFGFQGNNDERVGVFERVMLKWLEEHEYHFRVDWGEESRDYYPRMLVAVSPEMMATYTSFHQLLCFDILYDLTA